MTKLKRKLNSLIVLASFSSLLTSCAIAPPDVPICTELDITKGWCTNTISSTEFVIDEQHPWSPTGDPKDAMTWWQLRPTMVMLPYGSWAEVKAFIIKICKKSNDCSQAISNWERSVNGMDSQLDQKLP